MGVNAKANARRQRRTRIGGSADAHRRQRRTRIGGKGSGGRTWARKAGAARSPYLSPRSGATIIIIRAQARAAMNASTRLMFTIAGCALGVAAVGGIIACLAVLLL
jgi:hypothetical protein